MLSKDQIKFMKQLEKMQEHTGAKNKEPKRKMTMENYFKVSSDMPDAEEQATKTAEKSKQPAPIRKSDISSGQQKRSTTNLKLRDRSKEKGSEIKSNKQMSGDHNKYKSSIEPNVYVHEPSKQVNQFISHNQCASQSINNNNHILALEKKTTSEP